ncbi:MAG TPA: NDP-sugar synthase, partial [Thermoplasmata archaeon]|nr:NDP-sugar synthase [Thermoplasmata archaeon]
PSAEVKGASFGPFATVGAGVRLGAGAHVEDSVVLDGATIGRGASVTGSLVGPGAIVPDGVTLTRQILGARAGA